MNIRLSIMVLTAVLLSILMSCREGTYVTVHGDTMGTTYSVTYSAVGGPSYQSQLDSILAQINQEVSTYIPNSTISVFNRTKGGISLGNDTPHFMENWEESASIYELTDGYFDPSVMPLVNYWGFGYTEKHPIFSVDSLAIDTMMSYVGLNNIRYDNETNQLLKSDGREQLDFSAIAKGYAVDALGRFLESQGISNYLVEIGGEIVAKGVNKRGVPWTIAINTPEEDAGLTDAIKFISVSGKALASSGNYRNFYDIDGIKYGHTINPKSGYPFMSSLLGVTVITDKCIRADAFATALMSMGFPEALEWVKVREDVEACFFIGRDDQTIQTIYSDGFIQYVREL